MFQKIGQKVPLVSLLLIVVIAVIVGGTIYNVGITYIGRSQQPPEVLGQTSTSSDSTQSEGLTTEVIYRGTPRAEDYSYTHPTAFYALQVPAQWLLGFTGTPYNPHLATVLHSPDFVEAEDKAGIRKLESGSEFFVYVELPRHKTPTVQSEVDYFTSLGQTSLSPIEQIKIDGIEGLRYYRDIGDKWLPYQTALIEKDGLMYRFLYRTAIADESNPLESFKKDQYMFDSFLSNFTLPLSPPRATPTI